MRTPTPRGGGSGVPQGHPSHHAARTPRPVASTPAQPTTYLIADPHPAASIAATSAHTTPEPSRPEPADPVVICRHRTPAPTRPRPRSTPRDLSTSVYLARLACRDESLWVAYRLYGDRPRRDCRPLASVPHKVGAFEPARRWRAIPASISAVP
jgi:hypothetical protein